MLKVPQPINRVFLLLAILSATPSMGWSQAKVDTHTIEQLLQSETYFGPNCVSSALLGTGLIDVPIFISSFDFDSGLGNCFQTVTAPRPGDWGNVRMSGLATHFFVYLGDGKVFSKADYASPFTVITEEQVVDTDRSSPEFSVSALRYVGGPQCALEQFRAEARTRRPLIRDAARFLRGHYGLSETFIPSKATIEGWENLLVNRELNKGLSFLNRAMLMTALPLVEPEKGLRLGETSRDQILAILKEWNSRVQSSSLTPKEKMLFEALFVDSAEHIDWSPSFNVSKSIYTEVNFILIQPELCQKRPSLRNFLNCEDTNQSTPRFQQALKNFARVIGGEVQEFLSPVNPVRLHATAYSRLLWQGPDLELIVITH